MTDIKEQIVEIMASYIEEMEGYCYYGSNPGIPEDDIEELAGKIINHYNEYMHKYLTQIGE